MPLKIIDSSTLPLNSTNHRWEKFRKIKADVKLHLRLVFMEKGVSYPGWKELSKESKLQVIEELFSEEIRPYIELDEGGVRILDLVNECDVMIAYEGACTSCYSSIGTTLSSIQEILQTKLHPSLQVIPNLDELTLK